MSDFRYRNESSRLDPEEWGKKAMSETKLIRVIIKEGYRITGIDIEMEKQPFFEDTIYDFQELNLPSNLKEIIETLEKFNLWRRDVNLELQMPDPTAIGIALDKAIETLKQLEP